MVICLANFARFLQLAQRNEMLQQRPAATSIKKNGWKYSRGKKTYCRLLFDVEPLYQAMSEFRFTCPVCGQHMAVDTGAAGAQIECPTCFQRIIVPQAPRADSRYILSATQYIKPQVTPSSPPTLTPPVHSRGKLTSAVLISAIFIVLLAAALYLLFQKSSVSDAAQSADGATGTGATGGSDEVWSLNLGAAPFPGAAASGKIHDKEFICQRAILQGGALALTQNSGSTEMIVNVYFPAGGEPGKDSRYFDVRTNLAGTRPRITLRWREGSVRGTQTFSNGYAMKLELNQSAANKAPGKIYLCLPDDARSFVAGTFDAEIHGPLSAKQR
jgi:hypothetical protein